MGQLDGKVAIVTGATSGIGERIAEVFVAEGARVVGAGRRTDEGEALAARCGEALSFDLGASPFGANLLSGGRAVCRSWGYPRGKNECTRRKRMSIYVVTARKGGTREAMIAATRKLKAAAEKHGAESVTLSQVMAGPSRSLSRAGD